MNHKFLSLVLAILFIIGGIMLIDKNKVHRIARAIAKAEGFGVEDAIPTVANNPGDIKAGDLGNGTLGAGITVFDSLDEGWNHLYSQVTLMLNGKSRYYNPSMTIRQVAETYVGAQGAEDWANNVATELGVTPDTTLGSIT